MPVSDLSNECYNLINKLRENFHYNFHVGCALGYFEAEELKEMIEPTDPYWINISNPNVPHYYNDMMAWENDLRNIMKAFGKIADKMTEWHDELVRIAENSNEYDDKEDFSRVKADLENTIAKYEAKLRYLNKKQAEWTTDPDKRAAQARFAVTKKNETVNNSRRTLHYHRQTINGMIQEFRTMSADACKEITELEKESKSILAKERTQINSERRIFEAEKEGLRKEKDRITQLRASMITMMDDLRRREKIVEEHQRTLKVHDPGLLPKSERELDL